MFFNISIKITLIKIIILHSYFIFYSIMNKYTLNFKDKEIESNYQNITQQNFRVFTLTIMTLGLFIVALTKIIESILVKEYQTIYKYCLFICYLLI